MKMMEVMPETIEQALEICIEKITHQSISIEACLSEFPQYRHQLAEVLPLMVSLKALHQVKPSESFSKHAAKRLVNKLPNTSVTFSEAVRLLFQRQILYPIRRFSMFKLMITLLMTLFLLAGGTNLVQATGPGDVLYPLDRAFEVVRLRITADPVEEIILRVMFAGERLAEAELKLGQGKLDHALTAIAAYDDAFVELEEKVGNQDGQVRESLRIMLQEELALQAGTLDRIRLNWPEDAQARNAFHIALQRSNMGVEHLFGPPESAPQGPNEDAPQGPNEEVPQGPSEDAPQGPNEEAPQGPIEDAPQVPNEDAPQGPNEDAPQGPTEDAPQSPNEDAPQGPTITPPKGPTKTTP
jgi:hypothetical protein